MTKDYNEMLAASTCVEHSSDCSGQVEFYAVKYSLRALPRCRRHAELLGMLIDECEDATCNCDSRLEKT